MGLAWKVMIPLSAANVVIVMCVLEFGLSLWWSTAASAALFALAGILGTNAARAELQRRGPRLAAV
jgi:hypothetical protein